MDGLQVLYRLQLGPVRLPVEPEEERGAHDGDGAQGHGGRAHPGLQLEAERGEDPGGNRDPDQVVGGGEDEVEPDAAHRLLGQVQAADHVKEVVLEKILLFVETLKLCRRNCSLA